MKNKRLVLLLILYVLFIGVVILSSNTLTKYITNTKVNGNFDIGKNLYFQYERGDLYRNNQLIVGVEVQENEYDNNNNVIDVSRRIETMNVIPGDTLVYHFYINNYNQETKEANGMEGIFKTYGSAILAMPVKNATYDLSCEIVYREVDKDGIALEGENGAYKKFTSDLEGSLPEYVENNESTYKRYEFEISVTLNDQMEDADTDDYFDATLSIYLTIVSANKEGD